MAESQEIGALRRRGRRRLVGAIALVLLAVIVLPMVFDSEPRQGAPAVSVRIPSEDDAGFSPKATPKVPVTPVAPKPAPTPPQDTQKAAPAPRPEPKAEEKRAPEAAAKPSSKDAERARAEAALAGSEQFYVQVGAFVDPEKVKEITGKLKSAQLPHYTEQVPVANGHATRVRVGPFGSREAAEKVRETIRGLGLNAAAVAAKT
ncbi:MAG TPA: SPOR domain-containing protein [Burkholderiales bacterium]|jgi:DedD protein|nr:SPOR domain-containing protein [Burkholderiales bacterium]